MDEGNLMYKCDKCGQAGFVEMVEYNKQHLCTDCISKELNRVGDIIKLEFPDDVVYLPLQPNLDKGHYVDNPLYGKNDWNGRHHEVFESAKDLLLAWDKFEWCYSEYYKPTISITTCIEEGLVLKHPKDTQECSEFDIVCFKELMVNPEHYNTPWDTEPNGRLFSCNLAVDCEEGIVYSKDFDFFECVECKRKICHQNPANGWHTQSRLINEDYHCLQCLQDTVLESGIPIEDLDNDRDIGAYAMFYSYDELTKHNWKHYRDGHDNEKVAINLLCDLYERGKQVLLNIDRMGIGGLEVYWSIYIKEKDEKEVL